MHDTTSPPTFQVFYRYTPDGEPRAGPTFSDEAEARAHRDVLLFSGFSEAWITTLDSDGRIAEPSTNPQGH